MFSTVRVMKPLYILKIGGSVATHKNRPGYSIRRSLLGKIAQALRSARKKKDFDLILIHGAGALGHSLAKQYGLKNGTGTDVKKMRGALLSRSANQRLDGDIVDIFTGAGLSVVAVHTASVIVQHDQMIKHFDTAAVKAALDKNCIPMLYGDMVFDEQLGMSICSGDAIAPPLALEFGANKIFFASDIDGVMTKDPFIHADAELIEEIPASAMEKEFSATGSHNVDVTGGLGGKMKKIERLRWSNIETVEIFNGLDEKNYEKIFLEKDFPHTTIFLK